jgi:hypothetical protein
VTLKSERPYQKIPPPIVSLSHFACLSISFWEMQAIIRTLLFYLIKKISYFEAMCAL